MAQESFAFNHELPTENVTRTTQCWGFLESQETTAVSPETFGEFVFPYQDRLVRRFGLLSYGCCERVDRQPLACSATPLKYSRIASSSSGPRLVTYSARGLL